MRLPFRGNDLRYMNYVGKRTIYYYITLLQVYNNNIMLAGWLAAALSDKTTTTDRNRGAKKSFISYQNKKLLQQEENERVDSLDETKISKNKEVEFAHSFIRLTLNMALRDGEGDLLFFFFKKKNNYCSIFIPFLFFVFFSFDTFFPLPRREVK